MTADAIPFLKRRYRVIPHDSDGRSHWIGGAPHHDDASCPTCGIPFLVLWDINCRDSRFPEGRFGAMNHLPLYFCWRCINDQAYQIDSSDGIRVFKTEHTRAPLSECFYDPYPAQFPRCPISLVPSSVEDLLATLRGWDWEEDFRGETLTDEKRKQLSKFFGHPVKMQLCLFHSQFGGRPSKMGWGQEPETCPNPKCPSKGLFRRFVKRPTMRFLAGILNDPFGGLPMIESTAKVTTDKWNFDIGVEFLICEDCLTIYARQRCD